MVGTLMSMGDHRNDIHTVPQYQCSPDSQALETDLSLTIKADGDHERLDAIVQLGAHADEHRVQRRHGVLRKGVDGSVTVMAPRYRD